MYIESVAYVFVLDLVAFLRLFEKFVEFLVLFFYFLIEFLCLLACGSHRT